ncbi:MAG: bifunctional 4-hydroxy-2-oxoglutarate aldolase/2-dehydro-3-deoxy-phosphogluconate aldolase [Clostridia bacterium]|nr:bifunctional 4-hydroxy-2-oxoglutarate aldolase/2-dehydro-3-deoxy-phosphogluconate aldolase [Clostridia bacterium]
MNSLEYLRQRKIIAIVRNLNSKYIIRLGHALEEGGIGLIEVSFNQSNPESWADTARAIEAIAKEFGDRLLVGAGTVINTEQVDLTCEAGGCFLVMPATIIDVMNYGREKHLGLFPGAFSATEIMTAFNAGADAVKLFPASSVGPEYIKSVRAPLSHIPVIAVGGIYEGNVSAYMHAGCVGVGIGEKLIHREWVYSEEWNRITELAKTYVRAVNE